MAIQLHPQCLLGKQSILRNRIILPTFWFLEVNTLCSTVVRVFAQRANYATQLVITSMHILIVGGYTYILLHRLS